jgi:hypothetical protein
LQIIGKSLLCAFDSLWGIFHEYFPNTLAGCRSLENPNYVILIAHGEFSANIFPTGLWVVSYGKIIMQYPVINAMGKSCEKEFDKIMACESQESIDYMILTTCGEISARKIFVGLCHADKP